MFDGDMTALGNLSRLWTQFFSNGQGWVSQGTHAERLTTNPGGVPDGAFFIETDRGAIYQSRFVGTAQAWVLVAGFMTGVLAARPKDLGPNDSGLFFSATDALDYRWNGTGWATLDTARGGGALTHVGRMVKVTAAGVIGEAAFADTAVVLGATALTTDGAIPKVSATDGTLAESNLLDDGTTVYAAARNLGVGASAPAQATSGRRYLYAKGDTHAGGADFSQGDADANGVTVAIMQATDTNSTEAEKRIAAIVMSLLGGTANKRGGAVRIFVKTDNISGLVQYAQVDDTGVTVVGNVVVSGVYKVGANQVVGARQANIPVVTVGGTTDANARATIASILGLLQAHGLMT